MLKKNTEDHPDKKDLSQAGRLLAWYAVNGRALPWRGICGANRDYKVWLSEVMLQQTTIVTATPYYHSFLKKWPSLQDLALSSLDDVLRAWSGLGYYARARNLHKCAVQVMSEHNGVFPLREEELLALPGIGPYTAAAMCAILTDHPSVVIDGNVERVISRLYAVETPLPKSKPLIKKLATELTPLHNAGDYAQALMDLGATICTPRSPKCDLCPWRGFCLARKSNAQEKFPLKEMKKPKPKRYGAVFWLRDMSGRILIETRPEQGIFGGMRSLPGTQWDQKEATKKMCEEDIIKSAPVQADWVETGQHIRHVFTHFDLHLDIWQAEVRESEVPVDCEWVDEKKVMKVGLPSAMKKVATLMIKE